MMIPVVNSVGYLNKTVNVSSVQHTQTPQPSFGYNLGDKPYEREALQFLRTNFPKISEAMSANIKRAVRFGKENAGELTDLIMDKGVLLAEKLGFESAHKPSRIGGLDVIR